MTSAHHVTTMHRATPVTCDRSALCHCTHVTTMRCTTSMEHVMSTHHMTSTWLWRVFICASRVHRAHGAVLGTDLKDRELRRGDAARSLEGSQRQASITVPGAGPFAALSAAGEGAHVEWPCQGQVTGRRPAAGAPLRVRRPLAGPRGPRGARGPDGTPEPHVAALGPAPVQLRTRSSVSSSVRRGPSSPCAVSWGA